MAVEADLIFESFLKKRKDKMGSIAVSCFDSSTPSKEVRQDLKFTWAKYWFRLQNTTLYFFTKKHGDALCLRGLYSMYTSAESAEICTAWIEILWKSMQLPGPGREYSACTWHDVASLMERAQVARDNKEESHYNTVLYVEETFDCTSRVTDLLISKETKKTLFSYLYQDFNEDKGSAIYETLKMEPAEDKPSDETGESGGDAQEEDGAAGCATSVVLDTR